jgi:hypothetical protein
MNLRHEDRVKIRFIPQDRSAVFGEVEVYEKHIDEIPRHLFHPMSWDSGGYVIITEDVTEAHYFRGEIMNWFPLGKLTRLEDPWDTPKIRLTLSVDNQTHSEHEVFEADLDHMAPVLRYLKASPYMKGNTGIVALASIKDADELAKTIRMYNDCY